MNSLLSMERVIIKSIVVPGCGIEVMLTRKKVKNINLRVKRDGSVSVSAPCFVSEARIIAFLESKSGWLSQRRERLSRDACEPRFLDGELVPLFGEDVECRVVCGCERNGCALEGGGMVLRFKNEPDDESRAKAAQALYRELLAARISERLPELVRLSGLDCQSWHIRKMVSRWGSCNVRTGRLCFALGLAQKPPMCLDYVIVHELAHLRFPGHDKDFYAFVSGVMPEWCEAAKALG